MKSSNGKPKELPEPSLRVLRRLLEHMRNGANVEISIKLNCGGIHDYRESVRMAPADMQPSDATLVAQIGP